MRISSEGAIPAPRVVISMNFANTTGQCSAPSGDAASYIDPSIATLSLSGAVACDGRGQVLAWLRAAPAQPPDVDPLELLANDDHAVLGVRTRPVENSPACSRRPAVHGCSGCARVTSCDYAHRADALADAGLDDRRWC